MPLTHLNLLLRVLGESNGTILDVGCGQGGIMRLVGRNSSFSVGIDISSSYLNECKKIKSHDGLILGDVRSLPFRRKSFNLVLCFELIEHLTKEEGIQLIKDMEETAQQKVVIGTPVNGFSQELLRDNNQFQAHKSTWIPSELQTLGYHIISQGIFALEKAYRKSFGRPVGPRTSGKKPRTRFNVFYTIVNVLAFFLRPLSYFRPELGFHMIGYKKLEDGSFGE